MHVVNNHNRTNIYRSGRSHGNKDTSWLAQIRIRIWLMLKENIKMYNFFWNVSRHPINHMRAPYQYFGPDVVCIKIKLKVASKFTCHKLHMSYVFLHSTFISLIFCSFLMNIICKIKSLAFVKIIVKKNKGLGWLIFSFI